MAAQEGCGCDKGQIKGGLMRTWLKGREQIKFTDHSRLEMEKDGISADDVLNAIEFERRRK